MPKLLTLKLCMAMPAVGSLRFAAQQPRAKERITASSGEK